MTKKETKKRPGPDYKATDTELKTLALETKKKFGSKPLTYLGLEKETGIGRNTWKRRIERFIKELNNPIPRSFDSTSPVEAYFPNIEDIFEKYGDNKQRIINELLQFELLFQELFIERNNLLKKISSLEKKHNELNTLQGSLDLLIIQKDHYQSLYEEIIISSIEPHLRAQFSLKNNLLEMHPNSLDLNQIDKNFPIKVGTKENTNSNDTMKELKNRFGKLFD